MTQMRHEAVEWMRQDVLVTRRHVRAGSGSFSAFVLAAAVLLTSATQLRASAAPVGPGELLLLLWAFSAIKDVLRGGDIRSDSAFLGFALFWGVTSVLLPLGWFVALLHPNLPVVEAWVIHSAQALTFTGVLTCLMANHRGDEHFFLSAARYYVILAGLTFSGLLALGQVMPIVAGIELWEWHRFRGWSENANQLGLFCVVVPFLACYLWRRDESVLRRTGYIAGLLACVAVGIATDSDAAVLGWLVAAGVMITIHWVQHWGKARSSSFAVVMYDVMVPVTLLVLGWWLIGAVLDDVWRAVVDMYQKSGQGALRLRLWASGIGAISKSASSLLVGLGPGPHAYGFGPMGLMESHNTYIDWFTTTGVIGLMSLLLLLGWLVLRTLKADALSLFGLMIGLMVFSVTHFTLRQFVSWFALVLVANFTTPARAAAQRWKDTP
jgi:O-Antigen ligase